MTERLHLFESTITVNRRPLRTLRAPSAHSHLLRDRLPLVLAKTLFFRHPQKNDPHIRIPAAFPGPGWDKLGGKNGLDSRAFSGLWVRCKSAVFWQSKREMGVFSTGTEKEGFTRFSVFDRIIWMGNGARIGLIFPEEIYPPKSFITS